MRPDARKVLRQGVRLRTLRREVAWFPPGADRFAPSPEGQVGSRPPSTITSVHHDGNGLLYVIASVVSDRWRPMIPRANIREHALMEGEGPFADVFLQGSRVGFRRMEDAGGIPG